MDEHTHTYVRQSPYGHYIYIFAAWHTGPLSLDIGCFNKSRNVSHEASVAHPAGGFHLISLRPTMSCTHNWSLTHNRPSSFVDHPLGVNQDTDGHDFPDLTCFCKADSLQLFCCNKRVWEHLGRETKDVSTHESASPVCSAYMLAHLSLGSFCWNP